MTAATLAVGYVLLLPYELDELARSGMAMAAMSSNIYFWRTADYFFAFAHWIIPLLHSWSLGVEEQFYLLFPATLVIAGRLRKAKLAVALPGLGSFFLCILAVDRWPVTAFYLLPTRGWELMVGAALAVRLVRVPKRAIFSVYWAGTEEEGGDRFWKSVQLVVDQLSAKGRHVFVLAGIPDPGVDVPWPAPSASGSDGRDSAYTAGKRHIPLRNATVIDVSSGFCRKPAYLLYRDSNHPSRYAGLSIIAPAIRNSLNASP